MRTTSTLFGTAAAMLILLSVGCTSVPTVRVDKDTSVNLHAYKTFAFFKPAARSGPSASLDPAGRDEARNTTLQVQHMQRATRTQMEQQGYVYDDAHPDLCVNVFLHVDEKFELLSIAGAYGYIGLGDGVENATYRQGALSVDLVDAHRKALVWQGVVEGRVNTQTRKDPGPAIEAAVAQIFAVFPNGKGK